MMTKLPKNNLDKLKSRFYKLEEGEIFTERVENFALSVKYKLSWQEDIYPNIEIIEVFCETTVSQNWNELIRRSFTKSIEDILHNKLTEDYIVGSDNYVKFDEKIKAYVAETEKLEKEYDFDFYKDVLGEK